VLLQGRLAHFGAPGARRGVRGARPARPPRPWCLIQAPRWGASRAGGAVWGPQIGPISPSKTESCRRSGSWPLAPWSTGPCWYWYTRHPECTTSPFQAGTRPLWAQGPRSYQRNAQWSKISFWASRYDLRENEPASLFRQAASWAGC
jgi:hypothetical protein